MHTRLKVFASYNILQYLCDFIHVLIFVTVSKCRKSPKLMNIVISLILLVQNFASSVENSVNILLRPLVTAYSHMKDNDEEPT
jgi:hypothetical protein